MVIGEQMRQLRIARGLSQKELGDKIGIDSATVGKYERGKLNPKLETVKKIAAALNVPEAFFYPIDEQIETAKREAKSELWAAETLARDNGKPWDVPTYNQERERVILDMSRRYSVAAEILFAFIPQRTDDEYGKDAIWIDSTHVGSAKNKARNLFNSLQSDVQKKAAVQIAIDDLWSRYGEKPLPVFEAILSKCYEENDAHTLKLVEDLEALVYGSTASPDQNATVDDDGTIRSMEKVKILDERTDPPQVYDSYVTKVTKPARMVPVKIIHEEQTEPKPTMVKVVRVDPDKK